MSENKLPDVVNNPGGIKDQYDERDYLYHEIAGAVATPVFDWDKGFDIEETLGFKLPVKDQNGSLSCGGQAWSSYGSVLEFINDLSFEERSAKFIYCQAVYPGGGTTGRDNCKVSINSGFAREVICPSYQNGNPPNEQFMTDKSVLTPEVVADAKKDRAYSYANVTPNIDLFAQAIANNAGMCIGLDGADNGTWRSAFPKPPPVRMWGHWIYAGKAKKISGKKYIGILNSWGTLTGERGWQWLGEDYFQAGAVWPGWTFVWDVAPLFSHYFVLRQSKDDVLPNSAEVKALQIAMFIDGKADGTFQDSDWKTVEQVMTFGGYFGDATLANLKRFQQKHGLVQTGVTDPATNTVLNTLFNR